MTPIESLLQSLLGLCTCCYNPSRGRQPTNGPNINKKGSQDLWIEPSKFYPARIVRTNRTPIKGKALKPLLRRIV